MEIANFFWDGKLTELEKNCIRSFHRNGFKVKLWSYDNIQVENIETCDANLVTPRVLDLPTELNGKTQEEALLATFSDYFRFKVVDMYGGWWFDADCFCLKNVSEFKAIKQGRRIVTGKIEFANGPQPIMSGAFWVDERLCKQIFEELQDYIDSSTKETKSYGFFGPEFLTNFVHRNHLENEILPQHVFYAMHWNEANLMMDPYSIDIAINRTKNSLLTHIWTKEMKENNVSKDNPTKGSFLDMLYNIK